MSLNRVKYDIIRKEYHDRQLARQHLIMEHRQELYDHYPAYKELDDQIADLSVLQAKRLIQGDDQALPVLRTRLSELSSQKATFLKEHHISTDYLDPPYVCANCKDTGYHDGEKCFCLKQTEISLLYEQSNLKSVLQKENFDFFSYQYYNESETERMEKVVEQSHSFISHFDEEYRNLLFFGNVGCGKTFLSNCIAKELLDTGHSVIYFTAFQLFDLIARKTFRSGRSSDHVDSVYEDIFSCDFLVIDDLGTETVNSFTVSQLFLILNERHQREKSTLISTNMSMMQLKDTYSERSISRILGNYELYLFKGEDIRPKKQRMENRK